MVAGVVLERNRDVVVEKEAVDDAREDRRMCCWAGRVNGRKLCIITYSSR
jgi:hypothetical protein